MHEDFESALSRTLDTFDRMLDQIDSLISMYSGDDYFEDPDDGEEEEEDPTFESSSESRILDSASKKRVPLRVAAEKTV